MMIDLSEHGLLVCALACVAELTYRMYARSVAKASSAAAEELAVRLHIGLQGPVWHSAQAALFQLRMLQHYQWVRNQGAEWPEEWKR